MAVLVWDKVGERFYEMGVDRGVLYLPTKNVETGEYVYSNGVAWNGLTNVSQSPSGGEANPQWADNIKYLNLMSVEEFGATIEAFMYPDEFRECNGEVLLDDTLDGVVIGQQPRKSFGFAYRTLLGNDVDGDEYGYKIHLVYGCLAAPSERTYETKNDSPEPGTLSWEITTTPVEVSGKKPTATVEITKTAENAAAVDKLETVLYGSSALAARMPLPSEIKGIMTIGG